MTRASETHRSLTVLRVGVVVTVVPLLVTRSVKSVGEEVEGVASSLVLFAGFYKRQEAKVDGQLRAKCGRQATQTLTVDSGSGTSNRSGRLLQVVSTSSDGRSDGSLRRSRDDAIMVRMKQVNQG